MSAHGLHMSEVRVRFWVRRPICEGGRRLRTAFARAGGLRCRPRGHDRRGVVVAVVLLRGGGLLEEVLERHGRGLCQEEREYANRQLRPEIGLGVLLGILGLVE